ncbi:MAG: Nif3-like dinuclear metal center hexameric protein [Candidatus Thorarchaeota archaeon]
MTSLLDILKHIDIISPKEYSLPDREGYVEVGPITKAEQSNTTINRILVTVFPSAKVIAKASQEKANLIISFLPMFEGPTKQLFGQDLVKVRLLAKNYISTYVIGTSWIGSNSGLSDALSDLLNLSISKKFNIRGLDSSLIPIGRVCETPSKMNHSGFANYIASKSGIPNIRFTGSLDDEVNEVLVVAGSVLSRDMLMQSLQDGMKTIVTGELCPKDHILASKLGVNVFEMGAFVTEEPGMKRFRHQLSTEYPEMKIEFAETDQITHILRPYKDDRK